ncbi:MAG: hypothetical protein PF961_24085, partial [Planctomycetota bacterium]|nr:hypothetical protein [Planctomycetota bacterium]
KLTVGTAASLSVMVTVIAPGLPIEAPWGLASVSVKLSSPWLWIPVALRQSMTRSCSPPSC